jgi:nitroreductase
MAGIRVAVENNTLPAGMEFFAGILKAWDKGRDIIFRGAPHLLVVSTPIDGPSYEADTIIALTTFDLLAQSMGIGTLWNGFATWSITKIVPDMRRLLGIPENHYLGYVMSFGKPAVEYYRTVERGPALINRVSI